MMIWQYFRGKLLGPVFPQWARFSGLALMRNFLLLHEKEISLFSDYVVFKERLTFIHTASLVKRTETTCDDEKIRHQI